MTNDRPEVLIEKWLPIQQLGIESQRENSTGLHPPPNRLHVWWARTVTCPECNLTVPLSPNWWLQKEGNPPTGVAVRLIVPKENEGNHCQFEMVNVGKRSDYNPSQGTVSRGTGRCPRCGNTLTGDYIKTEAQEQRIGQQLYALVLKEDRGRSFRLPTAEDEQAVEAAERCLAEKLPEWEAKGWAPNDDISSGHKTDNALLYGFNNWSGMFSARQLLSLMTYLEHFQQVKEEIFATEPGEKAKAIVTYLAFAFDKCCDYNSRMCIWHPSRIVVAHTFARHDFGFKWSYGEMNFTVDGLGFDWAVKQVIDSYKGLCRLAGSEGQLSFMRSNDQKNRLHLTLSSASNLWELDEESIHLICVDPPYYDNVMYAELSDFFYVWQKRTLGDVYPEVFFEELTNKDDEAVANPARFAGVTGARNGGTGLRGEDGRMLCRDAPRTKTRRRANRYVHPQARRGVGYAGDGVD